MSMRSEFVTGLGFEVVCVPASKIFRFIRNHEEVLLENRTNEITKRNFEEFAEVLNREDIPDDAEYVLSDDLIDALDGVSMYDDAYAGFDLVEEIINKETGLGVEFHRGQDECIGEACIIFTAKYPWEYKDAEISDITKARVCEILGGYAEELGVEPYIQSLEVEYYG